MSGSIIGNLMHLHINCRLYQSGSYATTIFVVPEAEALTRLQHSDLVHGVKENDAV